MFFSKDELHAFIKQYGLAVSVAVAGHILLFGSMLFGLIDLKPDVKKFKIPEYTAINLVDLAPPRAAIKPEVKKPDDTKKKQEQKKLDDKKKAADLKKKQDAKKKADLQKKAEAKKIADAKKKKEAKKIADKKIADKKIADKKKEEAEKAAKKAAEKKRKEDEIKKKAQEEKERREELQKLKEEQDAQEWAELNDEFADINKELEDELKEFEDEKQRLIDLEAENKAAFDAEQKLSARQEQARARELEEMSIIENYASAIKSEITEQWKGNQSSRPYTAVLKIVLAPTGELVDVDIISTNGDTGFNQSLINAVENVGNYSVPEDTALFDEHFRTNTFTFGKEL